MYVLLMAGAIIVPALLFFRQMSDGVVAPNDDEYWAQGIGKTMYYMLIGGINLVVAIVYGVKMRGMAEGAARRTCRHMVDLALLFMLAAAVAFFISF